MAEYTLFTNPMSRGQTARWALHEVAAEHDTQLVDFANRPAALDAANPMHKVPTLIHHHGGDHIHVVTETPAICHYLAEMHPDAGLLPAADEKADYFRYFFFAAGPLEQAVVANGMGWKPEGPRQEGMAGFGSFARTMDALETMLDGRDYVCGDRFTMADVYVGSHVDWGLEFGSIEPRAGFAAYAERLRGREAYRSAKKIDADLIAAADHG